MSHGYSGVRVAFEDGSQKVSVLFAVWTPGRCKLLEGAVIVKSGRQRSEFNHESLTIDVRCFEGLVAKDE